MHIRALHPSDYALLSPVLDEWWGGRPVGGLLPRLFFEHFGSTSCVLEEDGAIKGFLVGFVSQSMPTIAYIHLVGVSPDKRKQGYGGLLYERFFDLAAVHGCSEVHCITTPINAGSIAFHTQLGFEIVDTGDSVDGIPVKLDYAGPGQHRVLFRKQL
ncbi:GNAT family N-acetyltransferase [Pigmentiphaga litoralis]|uniref:GNAT family N-acetyltransferase n=1 Tax=Pigmentiphaga litoralis TaxID=516702 RepID=UPI003B4334F7